MTTKKNYIRTQVNYMKSLRDIKKLLRTRGVHTMENKDGYDPIDQTYKTMFGFAFLDKINGEFRETPIAFILPLDHTPDDGKKFDQELNSIYRVLFFHIKALFVSIDYGLVDQTQAFMSNIMVRGPNGQMSTIYDRWLPSYIKALEAGSLNSKNLLPELDDTKKSKDGVIEL